MLLRTFSYAWWKPVVGGLIVLLGFVVLPVLMLPVLAIGVAIEGGEGSFSSRFVEAGGLETVTPSSMLYLNLALAGLTLLAMLVVRVVHGLPPRWLSSVRPGMRWKFFFVCLGLSVVALLASIVVGAVLPQDPNDLGGSPNPVTGTVVAIGLVVLLTTPLQALGEEYAFRGYLMQAFGSVSRSRVFAVLLTSILFALAHGVQNFPLFFDRFAFGVIAGLVVVLVGGLEAGIALHVLNNLVAFGLALFFGDISSVLNVSEASWWQLPVTVAQNGVYLVLVLLVARRMGLRSTTDGPAADARPVGAA